MTFLPPAFPPELLPLGFALFLFFSAIIGGWTLRDKYMNRRK